MRSTFLALLVLVGVLLAPALLNAEEVLKPNKAYGVYLKKARSLSPEEKKEYALAYLESWSSTGQTATGANRYALGQFQELAEQYEKALAGYRVTWKDEKQKDSTRDAGVTAEGALLLKAPVRALLGDEGIDKAAADLERYAPAMLSDPGRGKSRTKLLTVLARLHSMAGRYDDAHTVRMMILKEDPKQVGGMVMPIVRNLLASVQSMDAITAARGKAVAALKVMAGYIAKDLDQAKSKYEMLRDKLKASDPDAVDANGNLKKTSAAEMNAGERSVWSAARIVTSAEKLMAVIQSADTPFGMLGKPAPAWTLEHAFGDVSDLEALKGKVVILDFWATWPDECNFPVMRDLHKAYAEKGLAIVGVTATSIVCYEQRYDFDADMAEKAKGGRKFYAARLADEDTPANPDQAILDEGDYRKREIDAISAFVKNHALPWPHVMIDKAETDAKYAMEGWPGFVVIDKQGRIRYIRSGELGRDEKAGVAAVRKLLDALLAE